MNASSSAAPLSYLLAYDLAAPARLIFPVLTKIGVPGVEDWAWRELRTIHDGRRGWSIARRHAYLVKKKRCHYDDGDVHTGKLHCFCGDHIQGVQYGRIPRVMSMAKVTA